MRLVTLLSAVLFTTACQPHPTAEPSPVPSAESGASQGESGSGEEPAVATDENAGEEVEQSAPFSVHEWGLHRIQAGGSELATSGDRRTPSPGDTSMLVGKPLIYLHALDGFNPDTEITVQVDFTNGAFHEIWPAAEYFPPGSTHTFGPLQILPGETCGAELVPELETPFCHQFTSGGGMCETGEMHAYLSAVPDCLSLASGRTPVLLYNGVFVENRAPVTTTYNTIASTVTVTNTSPYPVGPLWIATTDQMATGRLFHRVDSLAAGAEVVLATSEAGLVELGGGVALREQEHDALIAEIEGALISRGLTDTEAHDFTEAWRPDVLAPEVTGGFFGPAPGPWTAFGFYSDAFLDAELPMTVTPAPAELVRVLAFSVETGA